MKCSSFPVILRRAVLIFALPWSVPAPGWSQDQPTDVLPGLDSVGFMHVQATVNTKRQIRLWTTDGARLLARQPRLDSTGLIFAWHPAPSRDTLALSKVLAIKVPTHRTAEAAVVTGVAGGLVGYMGAIVYDLISIPCGRRVTRCCRYRIDRPTQSRTRGCRSWRGTGSTGRIADHAVEVDLSRPVTRPSGPGAGLRQGSRWAPCRASGRHRPAS